MLGQLIFNKLKWFPFADNTNTVQASGKNFLAVPTQITIRKGGELPPWGSYESNFYAEEDTEVQCIGRGPQGYFFTGQVKANALSDLNGVSQITNWGIDQVATSPGFIHNADVKNVVWGGKSLLYAFVSRALSHFRKQVVIC